MFILRKVVGYVLIVITLIMISGCSTYSNPGYEIITFLDFEKYMEKGVFVTPMSYENEYIPIGLVNAYCKDSIFESPKMLQTYQANRILRISDGVVLRKKLADIDKDNIVYEKQTYWSTIIVHANLQEAMDLLVKEAKAKGADAIINIRVSSFVLEQDDYQRTSGVNQYYYEISGFAIKRIND